MKNFDLLTLAIGLGIGFVAKSVFDSECSCHAASIGSRSTMGDITGSGPSPKCRGTVRGWYFCHNGETYSCEGTGGIAYNPVTGDYDANCASCSPLAIQGHCTNGSYYLTIPHTLHDLEV